MSCSECRGYPLSRSCPICSDNEKEPIPVPCEECKGEGKIFLDPYNNIISKEEYDKSSDNEYIECWNCNGKGKLDE